MTLEFAMLDRLRGQLIVSCQPVIGGAMDSPAFVAAFARAALNGGAAGLRIEGLRNVEAVRAAVGAAVPIIGLVKRDFDGSDVRITPWLKDVESLAQAGADVITVDATQRLRPVPVADLVVAILARGLAAMADCATAADGRLARSAGASILGSTLSGYTGGPVPEEPDLDLVAALARLGAFVVAEGRYMRPDQAAQAMALGADAVTVGSAITRPEVVTAAFARAMASVSRPEARHG